jgi:hypothetical protein
MRKWSSQAAIWQRPERLLFQVYFPLDSLTSCRSQSEMRSDRFSEKGSLILLPPFFSPELIWVLKSPPIIQEERSIEFFSIEREFQQAVLSL